MCVRLTDLTWAWVHRRNTLGPLRLCVLRMLSRVSQHGLAPDMEDAGRQRREEEEKEREKGKEN